jgi:hypothetical protein
MGYFLEDEEIDEPGDDELDESDGERDPDPDRPNLEQPVLLRRPRFLRTCNRLVNSLEAARNYEANYDRLEPVLPSEHTT